MQLANPGPYNSGTEDPMFLPAPSHGLLSATKEPAQILAARFLHLQTSKSAFLTLPPLLLCISKFLCL